MVRSIDRGLGSHGNGDGGDIGAGKGSTKGKRAHAVGPPRGAEIEMVFMGQKREGGHSWQVNGESTVQQEGSQRK